MAPLQILDALSGHENQYRLNPDWAGCWIAVSGLWVYIARQPNGVQVEIHQPDGTTTTVAETVADASLKTHLGVGL